MSDQWATSIVENGFSLLPYLQDPEEIDFVPMVFPETAEKSRIIRREILRYQKLGVFEPVSGPPTQGPAHCARIFAVPTKNGKHRLIVDFHDLNAHLRCEHFHMQTLKEAKSLIKSGCYFASIDLQDAYLHVPIADDGSRELLHFLYENQLYKINSLMCGLNLAPRVFTNLLRPVMAKLRSQGVILLIYLDDTLLIAISQKGGKESVDKALAFLVNLGFLVNFAKSVLDPAQVIQWLGHLIDALKRTVSLPRAKLEMTRSMCKKFLTRAQQGMALTLKELASLVGKLNSCGDAINHTRIHSNSIRRDYQLAQMGGWKATRRWHLSRASRSELQCWVDYLDVWNRKLILQPQTADRVTASDASDSGWGGWIMVGPENQAQSEKDPMVETSGFWTHRQHKTELGLLGVQSFNKD